MANKNCRTLHCISLLLTIHKIAKKNPIVHYHTILNDKNIFFKTTICKDTKLHCQSLFKADNLVLHKTFRLQDLLLSLLSIKQLPFLSWTHTFKQSQNLQPWTINNGKMYKGTSTFYANI